MKSIMTTLAETCQSVADRLETLRPAGFSDADIIRLKATADMLLEMQRIANNNKGKIEV